jgi:hypothetical protein
MKKTIITVSAAAMAALCANGQDFIAGWDFADLGGDGLGTLVNGFENDVVGGVGSGTITTDLAQGSVINFASNGSQATGAQFLNGFDQLNSAVFGAPATGQQSLNILSSPSSAFNAFTVNFTLANDVVINFDWLNSGAVASNFGDFINISYSMDGVTFTPFTLPGSTAAGGYGAFAATSAWGKTTDSAFYNFLNQSDAVLDLTSVSAANGIQAVRFEIEGVAPGDRLAFDNIHVAGSIIPEPSSFAAIAGALALGLVAIRRRNG